MAETHIDLLDIDPETGNLFPPLMLADMRIVYAGHTVKDEGASLKVLRKEFKDNPRVFMDRLASMEKDWLAQQSRQKAAEAKAESSGPDEGTAVALRLAEDLLRGWQTGS